MSNPGRPTVVVTGAAGGMGAATCAVLVARGWHVVGVDHASARLAVLKDQLPPGDFTAVDVDLASPTLEEVVGAHLDETFAGLVNLAGISIGGAGSSIADDDWRRSFAVNVDAPMRLCRLCGPRLEARGAGSIVNVSSPVGLIGAKKASYGASKAALTGLTMSLARSLGPAGVRVNLLLPGATITRMTDDWSRDRRAAVASSVWLKRLCRPDEVGRVIAFLLSDDSSYMTGAVVDLTAGGLHGH